MVGYSPTSLPPSPVPVLIGYPGTEILTNEVVNSYTDHHPEQRERMSAYLMPKIIVGGFATVTVASVIFAGIIRPYDFRIIHPYLYIEIDRKRYRDTLDVPLKQKGCT